MLALEHRENVMEKKQIPFSTLSLGADEATVWLPRKQGASTLPPVCRQGRSTAMTTLHGRHLAARVQARRVSLALLLGFFGAARKGCVRERFLRKARNELGSIFRTLN